jgi:hypothetical protein
MEIRAIWYNLPTWNADGSGTNALEKGKAEWKSGLKARLDDMNYKEAKGTLPAKLIRNEAYEVSTTIFHVYDRTFLTRRSSRATTTSTSSTPQ